MNQRNQIKQKAAPGRFLFACLVIGGWLAGCGDESRQPVPTPEETRAAQPVDPARAGTGAQSAQPPDVADEDISGDEEHTPPPDLNALGPEGELPLFEIARDTYLLQAGNVLAGFAVNTGIIATGSGVVIIDSPPGMAEARRLRLAIEQVTPEPLTHVILTGPVSASLPPTLTAGYDIQLITGSDEFPVAGGSDAEQPTYARHTLYAGELTLDIYRVPVGVGNHALLVHQVDDDILWLGALVYNGTLIEVAAPRQRIRVLEWLARNFADTTLVVPGMGAADDDARQLFATTTDYLQRLIALSNDGDAQASSSVGFDRWRELELFDEHHPANLVAAVAESAAAQ